MKLISIVIVNGLIVGDVELVADLTDWQSLKRNEGEPLVSWRLRVFDLFTPFLLLANSWSL